MLECQLYQKELGMYAAKTKVRWLKSGVRSQEWTVKSHELEQEHAHEKVFAMSSVENLKP